MDALRLRPTARGQVICGTQANYARSNNDRVAFLLRGLPGAHLSGLQARGAKRGLVPFPPQCALPVDL
jgi:hypothetical protein